MFDESSELSARLFFLLEECLEYGLVVPFPAYGFAALVSHNESLNSLNRWRSMIDIEMRFQCSRFFST